MPDKPTGQFKGDQRPHAVSEKGERPIQVGLNRLCQRLDKRLELGERRLGYPCFPARKLYRTDLYLGRQDI